MFFGIIFYNDNARIQMRRIRRNMKHLQKLLFVIAILCSIWTIPAFAYTMPETVHIGLSNIGSAITLSNKTITIGAEENGVYNRTKDLPLQPEVEPMAQLHNIMTVMKQQNNKPIL